MSISVSEVEAHSNVRFLYPCISRTLLSRGRGEHEMVATCLIRGEQRKFIQRFRRVDDKLEPLGLAFESKLALVSKAQENHA